MVFVVVENFVSIGVLYPHEGFVIQGVWYVEGGYYGKEFGCVGYFERV